MSLENMSEKGCSPPKFLRLDDSLSEVGNKILKFWDIT